MKTHNTINKIFFCQLVLCDQTQQLDQLDLLEVVFYRLSNQIQRYLQAHSLSSDYTKCIVHQEIEETVTAALWQEGFTNMEIVNVTLCL